MMWIDQGFEHLDGLNLWLSLAKLRSVLVAQKGVWSARRQGVQARNGHVVVYVARGLYCGYYPSVNVKISSKLCSPAHRRHQPEVVKGVPQGSLVEH